MEKYFTNTLNMANLPTPIEELNVFTQWLDGPKLYIKREDMTSLEMTGNKLRKLDYILANGVKQGVDIIISCGSIHSNHLRICAIMARKLRIKAHLVIWREKAVEEIKGNYLLGTLTEASISYYNAQSIDDMTTHMHEIAKQYRFQGFTSQVIPLGANEPLGVLGYMAAVKEMSEQFKNINILPEYIAVAVGTGSTFLGLLVGIEYYKLPIRLIGFNVIDKSIDYVEELKTKWNEFCSYFNLDLPYDARKVEIIRDYTGQDNEKLEEEVQQVISKLAQSDGIFLGPVYTGKAMYGLCEEIRKGRFKKDEKVLFMHTGGFFELFE